MCQSYMWAWEGVPWIQMCTLVLDKRSSLFGLDWRWGWDGSINLFLWNGLGCNKLIIHCKRHWSFQSMELYKKRLHKFLCFHSSKKQFCSNSSGPKKRYQSQGPYDWLSTWLAKGCDGILLERTGNGPITARIVTMRRGREWKPLILECNINFCVPYTREGLQFVPFSRKGCLGL